MQHLASSTARIYVNVSITDTLSFWRDDVGTYVWNPKLSTTVFRDFEVPQAWVRDGKLVPDAFERIYEYFYGPRWREGNADGSRYVVLEAESEVVPSTVTPVRLG